MIFIIDCFIISVYFWQLNAFVFDKKNNKKYLVSWKRNIKLHPLFMYLAFIPIIIPLLHHKIRRRPNKSPYKADIMTLNHSSLTPLM
jgi:hypothetical protein